ncbi:MAG: hypothetical protein DMG22_18630 [Acidobacteria bacterium]|nr:MAG: hypothetical protein DMG22_18630 [Acidobacteriota bacterium]
MATSLLTREEGDARQPCNWMKKNSREVVIPSRWSGQALSPSHVILSEAKNPCISTQGKLREGSAIARGAGKQSRFLSPAKNAGLRNDILLPSSTAC